MPTSKVVLIGFVTFLLGLFAGLAVALYNHKQDLELLLTLVESQQVDIPHDVAFRLKEISAAEAGDTAWIIRNSCARVRSKARFINPGIFSGSKRAEVATLIERTHNKVHELEKRDLCSISH